MDQPIKQLDVTCTQPDDVTLSNYCQFFSTAYAALQVPDQFNQSNGTAVCGVETMPEAWIEVSEDKHE